MGVFFTIKIFSNSFERQDRRTVGLWVLPWCKNNCRV